ncbi:holin [Streptomyces sp. NPDC053560]|uniref:holin n=1 Tax=Streptomyces sp. NPDC053560 TaxID=3365711 RepID=UPI0037CF0E48
MPVNTDEIEVKVQAATGVAALLAVIVTVLNAVAESPLLGSLPGWLQGIILLLGPPVATFYAGWKARHTPRGSEPAPPPTTGPDGLL